MGNDWNVIGSCHGCDFEQLSHATYPHDIWLHDIETSTFDELAEAVSRELVLAGCELDIWMCAL